MKFSVASLVSAAALIALCNLHVLPTAAQYVDESPSAQYASWDDLDEPTELGDPVLFSSTSGEDDVYSSTRGEEDDDMFPSMDGEEDDVYSSTGGEEDDDMFSSMDGEEDDVYSSTGGEEDDDMFSSMDGEEEDATPCPTTPCPSTIPWEATHPFPSTHTDLATPCPTTGAADSEEQESVGECTDVSVEGDATYCVLDAVCSGDGDQPAGESCPRAGALASADCLETLASYAASSGQCVAPVDAVCRKIKTGAWGCVWADDAAAEATLDAATATGAGLAAGGSANGFLAVTLAVVGVMGAVVAVAALASLWARRDGDGGLSDDDLESSDASLDAVVTPPSSTRAAAFLRV